LRFDLVTEADDERRFVGAYQLVAPAGLSVISDIDDTIKRSEVHDREALLRNTFLKEFEAIDGMSGLYRTLHERGAVFHYLSSSPWQLFELLERFLAREEFPAGSFHLKQIRLKDRSFWNLFASPEETKLPVLERILQRFPQRRFALFGDAVEKDPEVYAELARRHPEQVAGIFIRVPLPQFDDEARFAEAFANLPRERWTTFTDPAELRAEPLFRTLLNQDDARRWREPVQRSQP
jgi:phosphatidate phosphatase APP1